MATLKIDRAAASEMKVELIDRGPCPLCGSMQHATHVNFRDIPVHRCLSCDAIFSAKVLSPEALAEYYRHSFGSLRHMQGQIVNSRVTAAAIAKLLDLSRVKSFLDVGAGYGFLMKALADAWPLRVQGVEPSEQEAEYANNTLKMPVHPMLLAHAPVEKESFDLVGAFEVIEHITDPIAFVRELTQYAAPSGHLIIGTDNFESGVVRVMGPSFPKWIPHAHVSHFTPSTLQQCVERAGGLAVRGIISFTPWELLMLALRSKLRSPRSAPEAYDLRETMVSEMGGTYRLFSVRRWLNHLWFRLSVAKSGRGEMMFLLAQRV